MREDAGGRELPARGGHFRVRQRQQPAERAVAVITQTVFIADGDEHQIQRPRLHVGTAQVIGPHQAVIDPTEVRRHPPQPFGL